MTVVIQESSIVKAISSLFSSYGPAVFNGLIVVSTIGGQSLVKRLTFTCPCAYPLNVYQSLFFFFGPSVALFLFAVLINQKTWRLVHGCWFRKSIARHPFSTALLYWSQIIGQALIAPVAWLFVALLEGDVYSCLRAGEFCHNLKTCPTTDQQFPSSTAEICDSCVCALGPSTLGLIQSQSQLLAWTLLVSIGLISLLTICLVKMCDRYTYVQSKYVKMYREAEKNVFDEVAREIAHMTAENNSRAFFGNQNLRKEDWDLLSSLPTLEDPFMFARHLRARDRVWPEKWAAGGGGDGVGTTVADYTTLQRWNNAKNRRKAAFENEQPALREENNGNQCQCNAPATAANNTTVETV